MQESDPDSVEVNAKTVDEAIEIALMELDLSRDQVKVEVLREGKRGLWGLGTEMARVRVTPQQGATSVESLALEACHNILRLVGTSAQVIMAEPPPTITCNVALDIRTEDSGILIGRRGETLAAMQFLVNIIVNRQLPEAGTVSLDVEGYRRRHYQSLQNLAQRIAERVVATGRPIALEPMPARERRVVHLALADREDVTTQSTGVDESRRVQVIPRSASP